MEVVFTFVLNDGLKCSMKVVDDYAANTVGSSAPQNLPTPLNKENVRQNTNILTLCAHMDIPVSGRENRGWKLYVLEQIFREKIFLKRIRE